MTLGDVITLKRGYDLPQRERRPGSVPVISSSGRSGTHDEAKAEAPGVVTGRYGTIGQVFVIDEPFWPLNTALYAVDFHGNHPRYCAELLRSLDFNAYDGKSGVPGLNRNDLHTAPVVVAPRAEQERIARLAAAIESAIESNRRLAALCEEFAAALFRSWFVDFDPVRAKAAGETPVGVPDDALDLFPDRLVDSEIGPIPEGWSVACLDALAERERASRAQRDDDANAPYLGLDHLAPGRTFVEQWGARGSVSGATTPFKTGEILFGKLRPYFRKVVVAPVDGSCSKEILVLRPRADADFALVLGHVASQRFIDFCDRISTGTRMPRAEWKAASEWLLAVPPRGLSAALTSIVRPLYDLILGAMAESRTLAELRDALLPELISGRLRVPPDDLPETPAP